VPRKGPSPPAPRRDGLERLSVLAATVLVAVVPFVWDGEALRAFRGPQAELALAAWAALAAAFLVRADARAAWTDPWWPAWGGVLAGGVLAALFSGQVVRALGNLLPVALAAMGWGALRRLTDASRRRLASLVVAAGVVEAVLVLAFLSPALQPSTFARLDYLVGRYGWIGTLGNPGYVGIFLTLPALLAAGRALEGGRRRLAWAAATLFLVAVVVGSQTLTAALALVAGGAVMAWRRVPRARRLPVFAGLVVVGLVVVLASPLRGRLLGAAEMARGRGLLWLGSARGAAYAAAGAMLAAHPLFGVGPGLFEANSFRALDEAALADRAQVLGLETGFGEAHNDLLQHAAETGAIGLLLALAGLALAVRRAGRSPGAIPDRAALLAAASVIALTQFPLHLAAVAAQWAVLAALAVPALPTLAPAAASRRRAELAIALVLAGVGATVAWQRHAAARAFAQGRALLQAVRAGASSGARADAARAALVRLQGRERWFPGSHEARLTLGSLALEAGQPATAIRHFAAALALAERPEIRYDIGAALLAAGEREAALTHFVRAIELNPAILRQVTDVELARTLRRRLDASGYGARHPWIYDGTPAATR